MSERPKSKRRRKVTRTANFGVWAVSLYSSSCTDSSFILAGQLLSAPYPCLPLVRLALTPGTLLHCSPLLLRGPYIFTKRSRPAREGEKRKNGREEPRNNRLRCIFLHNNTTSSSLPALYYSSSLFRVIHSTPTSSVLLRPLRCPPQWSETKYCKREAKINTCLTLQPNKLLFSFTSCDKGVSIRPF